MLSLPPRCCFCPVRRQRAFREAGSHGSPEVLLLSPLDWNSGEVSCPVISSTIFKFPSNVCKLQQLSWGLAHLLFTQLTWAIAHMLPEELCAWACSHCPQLAEMRLLWEKRANIFLCSNAILSRLSYLAPAQNPFSLVPAKGYQTTALSLKLLLKPFFPETTRSD